MASTLPKVPYFVGTKMSRVNRAKNKPSTGGLLSMMIQESTSPDRYSKLTY